MKKQQRNQWLAFGAAVTIITGILFYGFFGAPVSSRAQEPLVPTPVVPTAPTIDPAALRRALGIETPAVGPRTAVPASVTAQPLPPAKLPVEALPTPENEHATYLDLQRKRLAQEAQSLTALQSEIKKEIAQLETLRSEIDSRLAQEDEATKKKLAKLVKIYEAMRPADLVKVLSNLDEPMRLQLLSRMKQKIVTQVMAQMEPQLAAETSKKLMSKKVN